MKKILLCDKLHIDNLHEKFKYLGKNGLRKNYFINVVLFIWEQDSIVM